MTTHYQDFTGTPLVSGEVLGIRAWDVDPLGRITSPQYPHIWTPGENVAECRKDHRTGGGKYSDDEVRALTNMCAKLYPGFIPWDATFDDTRDGYEVTLRQNPAPDFVSPYSYRDMVYGSRRVASPSPTMRTEFIPAAVLGVRPTTASEHDFTTCTCGFYAYLNGTNDYSSRQVIGVVEGYGETFLGTRGFRTSKAKIVAAYASASADVSRVQPLPVSMERMRMLYPSVAWFDNYAAMVAEFPPSDPEPTPDLDDDFWTRSA